MGYIDTVIDLDTIDMYRCRCDTARRGERYLPRAAASQPQLRRQHRQDQRGGRSHPRGSQVEIFVINKKYLVTTAGTLPRARRCPTRTG